VVFYKLKAVAGRFNLHGQQLLRDIFEFRMLLLHLIYYDAAEFYLKVLTLKNTANFESIWYIGDRRTMEYIEELLKLSKQRVFKLKREIVIEDKPNKKFLQQDVERMIEDEIIERLESEINTNTFGVSESLRENEDENTNKGEEENNLMDIVKNPITYKGKTYRLDLKININFKYKALIEILKKITNQTGQIEGNPQEYQGKSLSKKIIWIWVQEDKKVVRIKDLLTSFFSKKDEHKIKLLLKFHALLNEMGLDKTNPSGSLIEEDDEEEEQPKNGKFKKKGKGSEEDIDKSIFKKLSQDLNHLKKEYDNKIMINLFNADNTNFENSLASQNTQQNNQQSEEVSGNQLITMLKPKKPLKRKFYDIESDHEEEKKEDVQPLEDEKTQMICEEKESEILVPKNKEEMDLDFDWNLIEEEIEKNDSNKRVLTDKLANEADKKRKYEYSILNIDKIDLNSFYSYNDDGQVIFDSELIPGYKIIVNSLGTTSERVSFINKTQPDIVVLFEPQLSLIREIMLEKRCSKYGGIKCQISEVHILMVQNSIESAIYLDNVRKENSAFVTLLNDRSSLPILDDNPESRIKKIIYQKNISTRIGRGIGYSASLNHRPIIIVDKREFNSPVPTKLYHDGFWIIPILLEKGDYVLSNSIVVERKCVETGDLLNSFRSGRLENQIKNLCASYSRPMLLIEFSAGVDFSLESAEINRLQHNINWVNDFESDKTEINKSNVKYGLSLLCMKYPKITILWSKSPEYTSKLFQRLKEHNPDPNPRDFAKYQEESEKNNDNDPFARHANEPEDNSDLTNLT